MSYSAWLHDKNSLHVAARDYSKMPVISHSAGLPPLHLVTLAESNQMCMTYVLPYGAPQQLFLATRDPNQATWGMYEFPVI